MEFNFFHSSVIKKKILKVFGILDSSQRKKYIIYILFKILLKYF